MALRLTLATYRLPFARPFVTASGVHRVRSGYIVRIADVSSGASGYGEVAPLPGHGGEPLDDARRALAAAAGALTRLVPEGSRTIADLSTWTAYAAREMAAAPCSRAGIELALADLLARRQGLPLARWLDPHASRSVAVNATIGAVSPDEAAARASDAVAEGYGTIKIKVGDAGGQARVAAVREAAAAAATTATTTSTTGAAADRGGVHAMAPRTEASAGSDGSTLAAAAGRVPAQGVRLRLDANGAWGAAEARIALAALARYGIELVEQPVAAADVQGLAALRRLGLMPIAADEALEVAGGWLAVLSASAADVLVLKPTLLGGPLAALAIAAKARAAGVGVIVTSALDSAVGRAGALHVAAALPELAGACGLATGGLLAADVALSPAPHRGTLTLPDDPGLGIEPSHDGDGSPLEWSTL